MKILKVSDDTYDWFQNRRLGMSENEFLNRLLNWWELLPTKPKIWRSMDSSAYKFIVEEKEKVDDL